MDFCNRLIRGGVHPEFDEGIHSDASIEVGRGYGQYDPSKHFQTREPFRRRCWLFRNTAGSALPRRIKIIMNGFSTRTGLGTDPAVALCCLLIHLHSRDRKLFEEKTLWAGLDVESNHRRHMG